MAKPSIQSATTCEMRIMNGPCEVWCRSTLFKIRSGDDIAVLVMVSRLGDDATRGTLTSEEVVAVIVDQGPMLTLREYAKRDGAITLHHNIR